MSKNSKKPVARKLNLGKKTVRRLSDEEVAQVAGGMPAGDTTPPCKCETGMRCCGGVPDL